MIECLQAQLYTETNISAFIKLINLVKKSNLNQKNILFFSNKYSQFSFHYITHQYILKMNEYQQICKSDNWALEGIVRKNQLKVKLVIQVSEMRKCLYQATVSSLDGVGQLSECFQGFDQVVEYMKDPSHLEIDKTTGAIAIIEKSPIRKNKLIKLAQIKPDRTEIIQQNEIQNLKKIRHRLQNEVKDLASTEIREIFTALVKGLGTLFQDKAKMQKSVAFCQEKLNDIKNQYAIRNKEPAKLIKTIDKIEEDGNLKQLKIAFEKLEEKVTKLEKINAQNLQKLGNLKDNKLDKSQLNLKLNQSEAKITKVVEEVKLQIEKKLSSFDDHLKISPKKIEFSPKKVQKQQKSQKKQEKKPEQNQKEQILKQKLASAAKTNNWLELQIKQNLDASAKSIEKLPQQFCSLTNLKTLKICNNQITSLPQNFGNIVSLKQLDISSNKLEQLPQSFGDLKQLNTLWCSANKIQKLPDSFCNLVNLKLLYLYNNKLQVLPENIGNLKILKTIWIYGNRLESVPDSFGNLKSLQELEINQNKFVTLSQSFCNLKYLQKLYIQFNKLTHLPECFGNMKSLKNLWIYNNKLQTLPETFGNLKSLQKLQIHQNKLKQLPKSLAAIEQLQAIQFTIFPQSQIKLDSLPITQWKNLKKLTINYHDPKEDLDSFTNKCRQKNIQVQFIQK